MDEPDFLGLAHAWLDGDPRSANLRETDPERHAKLVLKLAHALEQRRAAAEKPIDDKDALIVTVPEERFTSQGIDEDAMDQLEVHVQEHIEKFPED
ncbi:MAG: hypothetical protein KF760_15440 [Candidatus Eremiobacteraeota bacterium]|nr:hypothetical protein [Candidatus Eremiobacteraeota bacterium]MCW5872383.1 hypothetical protein [Candidatus Eremiobacteraeota bacterium]